MVSQADPLLPLEHGAGAEDGHYEGTIRQRGWKPETNAQTIRLSL